MAGRRRTGISRSGMELFVGGMAESIRMVGDPSSRINLSGSVDKARLLLGGPEALHEARVFWDWLMEQGYGPLEVKAWLARGGFDKVPYAAIGRLIVNALLRGGSYWLLRRWNRKQFAIIEAETTIYDLTDSYRINLQHGEANRFDIWGDSPEVSLSAARKTRLHTTRSGEVVRIRPIIGLVDEDFYYMGVRNVIIGFYGVIGPALPQPVPDAGDIYR